MRTINDSYDDFHSRVENSPVNDKFIEAREFTTIDALKILQDRLVEVTAEARILFVVADQLIHATQDEQDDFVPIGEEFFSETP